MAWCCGWRKGCGTWCGGGLVGWIEQAREEAMMLMMMGEGRRQGGPLSPVWPRQHPLSYVDTMPACLCVWCRCSGGMSVALCLASIRERPSLALAHFLLSSVPRLPNQGALRGLLYVYATRPVHAGIFIQVSHSLTPPPHTPTGSQKARKPAFPRLPPLVPSTFPSSLPPQRTAPAPQSP